MEISYSGGKKNPDLTIKMTENLHLTHRHTRRLIIISTDDVLYLHSPLRNSSTGTIYHILWVELSPLLIRL